LALRAGEVKRGIINEIELGDDWAVKALLLISLEEV
jgi:hypothetical protein